MWQILVKALYPLTCDKVGDVKYRRNVMGALASLKTEYSCHQGLGLPRIG